MDAERIVIAVDPQDRRLGINSLGEVVLIVHTHDGPFAYQRAVDNGMGWLHFVPMTSDR